MLPKQSLSTKTLSLQACLSILPVLFLSQKSAQVQLLEAEARRLRAHYFAPLPTAFPAQGGRTSGFVRVVSPPSFVNSSGSYSSSPESVCSISPYSSPGMDKFWQYICIHDPFVGRDAAYPWVKPSTAKAEPWRYRLPGASAFTARSAGSCLASKVDFYHAAGGEEVEDVGKLLAELRFGTTAVEM